MSAKYKSSYQSLDLPSELESKNRLGLNSLWKSFVKATIGDGEQPSQITQIPDADDGGNQSNAPTVDGNTEAFIKPMLVKSIVSSLIGFYTRLLFDNI